MRTNAFFWWRHTNRRFAMDRHLVVSTVQDKKTDASACNMSLWTGVWSHSDWSSESPVCKSLCPYSYII